MPEGQRGIIAEKNLRLFVPPHDRGVDSILVSAQVALGLDAVLVESDDREPRLLPVVQPVSDRVVVLEKQLAGRMARRRRYECRQT